MTAAVLSVASTETIVAIATPPGRGGIGIVRLSGPQALRIALSLLRRRTALAAGRATFTHVYDPVSNTVLDEAVVTSFPAPHSYTGEDIIEIATHGAPVVLEAVVRACVDSGARLAEPGEFTQRAFLSGRLDLTQAEGVHDLISATTLHQARVAASQLGGALSRVVQPIKSELITLIATLEAGIDFAEDDLEVHPEESIVTTLVTLSAALARLEQSYRYGSALREGRTLAIVGRPNVGKSSLFNALLDRDRAIVTATPGTTRDVITERVAFAGIPIQITDTAGIRHTTDEIEALGIARSRETLADAALVLLVIDATDELHAADRALLAELADRPVLIALNKCDLAEEKHCVQLLKQLRRLSVGPAVTHVSAQTREGLQTLQSCIHTALLGESESSDSAFLTNERQHAAVAAAQKALAAAQEAAQQTIPHEMILLDLHTALNALDTLTGATTADDILRLIFSTFCIGK